MSVAVLQSSGLRSGTERMYLGILTDMPRDGWTSPMAAWWTGDRVRSARGKKEDKQLNTLLAMIHCSVISVAYVVLVLVATINLWYTLQVEMFVRGFFRLPAPRISQTCSVVNGEPHLWLLICFVVNGLLGQYPFPRIKLLHLRLNTKYQKHNRRCFYKSRGLLHCIWFTLNSKHKTINNSCHIYIS